MADVCEEKGRKGAVKDGYLLLRRTPAGEKRKIKFTDVRGEAFFEGDIYLGSTDKLKEDFVVPPPPPPGTETFGIIRKGEGFRWPNKTVNYMVDPALPAPNRIDKAIAHWEAKTAIRFKKITDMTLNHVYFSDQGGCWSSVGMQGGGRQDLSLGTECTVGNAIHEIGHAVGLWHEQSRSDRATYVTLVAANVDPLYLHNFDQHIADGINIGAYDVTSIMHYPRDAFSINGQDTLVPTDKVPAADRPKMGQREGLSAIDIAAVKALYP